MNWLTRWKSTIRAWFRETIAIQFSKYKWARRWYGGKWECWYANVCCTTTWLRVTEFYSVTGKRPGGCSLPSVWKFPPEEEYPNVK
jgi:hypothetical protein